ncbi:endoglucanase 19-like protein [Carex littledalei]|uniref:Endoglucanase n=1 Tax=Carex littledalei TaxID=544730 RepID=A0A833QUB0_9POAL|nr:endoglucanase 19-like protein [Carex littledalei]
MDVMKLLVYMVVLLIAPVAFAGHDYAKALTKSILFFEAQRSGYLPDNQRISWRANSGLQDGKANGIDLVGGYYDAGDNVKFGLPMAFTVTMMAWSIIEYGKQMASSGELGHAMDAVKWGTDYFIKAHPEPYVLYGEVGDGNTDHQCWQRPEDMTTSRLAYRIDAANPGSDLAAETAAAMASASMVFHQSDPAYSNELLEHAKQLFDFADKYRGKYDSSITVAQKYYMSISGYDDELLWAAAWLYQATNDRYYLDYLSNNGDALGGTGWSVAEFGWDVKYAGAQVLATKFLLQGNAGEHAAVLEQYQQKAESFMCACIGKSSQSVQRTPGGLLYRQSWNNLQFVTSASFLLSVYSDYLASVGKAAQCDFGPVQPSELLDFAKSQVDYILGDNPRATSYMVGYGNTYPQQVHHRGSSIASIKVDPSFVSCSGGYATWFGRNAGDPNLLDGAIVGGPGAYDDFADQRDNYEQTEPTTYNNAPLLGVLARLNAGSSSLSQLLPGKFSFQQMTLRNSHLLSRESGSSVCNRAPSPINISQNLTTSWSNRGKTYYRYSVIVTNNSPKTIKDLHISISKLYGPLWGLTKSRYGYSFPSWLKSLPVGKSIEFVYIHSASPADIWVSGYKLV